MLLPTTVAVLGCTRQKSFGTPGAAPRNPSPVSPHFPRPRPPRPPPPTFHPFFPIFPHFAPVFPRSPTPFSPCFPLFPQAFLPPGLSGSYTKIHQSRCVGPPFRCVHRWRAVAPTHDGSPRQQSSTQSASALRGPQLSRSAHSGAVLTCTVNAPVLPLGRHSHSAFFLGRPSRAALKRAFSESVP